MRSGEPKPKLEMGTKQLLELQHVVSQVLAELDPRVAQQWIEVGEPCTAPLRLALNAGPIFVRDACRTKQPVSAGKLAHMKSWILSGKPEMSYIDPESGAISCRYEGFSIRNYLDALASTPNLKSIFLSNYCNPDTIEPIAKGTTIGKQLAKLAHYRGYEAKIGNLTYALDMLLDIATKSMVSATNIAHGLTEWFEQGGPIYIQTSTEYRGRDGEFITVSIEPHKDWFSDFTGHVSVNFEPRGSCARHHDDTWVILPLAP